MKIFLILKLFQDSDLKFIQMMCINFQLGYLWYYCKFLLNLVIQDIRSLSCLNWNFNVNMLIRMYCLIINAWSDIN